jgi:raffinose/stachyose/melibiose transport system permease protein
MVAKKSEARIAFAVFVLPALSLYAFFAIVPLFKGIWLSTTSWDGAAPWVPAQMEIGRFETEILGRAKSESDKRFLLKYYFKDEDQGTYRKLELIGLDRDRMMRIFDSLGYVNPDMRKVGFKNYLDIFTARIDARFFPQRGKAGRFNIGDPLESALSIPAREFERNFLSRVKDGADRERLLGIYKNDGGEYRIGAGFVSLDELGQQLALVDVPALADTWEDLYLKAGALGEAAALDGSGAALGDKVAALASSWPPVAAARAAKGASALSGDGYGKILSVLGRAADYGWLKRLLADDWYVEEIKMGVLVFTLFFVLFFVAGVNVLGMALALALDAKMRSRNVLRAVFYIPNVLSMIIVAFIWQLVFTQLLPALTGVRQIMNDPALAPWITVMVAVWQGVGYYAIIYLAGLQSIPQELLESASIDGARGWKRFTGIVLPMLAPSVTICLFLSISGALKTFDIIFALYPGTSTPLGIDNITVNIFYDAFRDQHAGLATAKAVLLMLVIVAVTGAQLLLTKRKEVEL